MKNEITCKNCNTSNSFYLMNCKSCGTILRTRVVNIDLWKTIWQLVETPFKAFSNIIFAEHKNFVSFLLILIGLKLFVNASFIFNLILPKATSEFNIPLQMSMSIVLTVIIVLLFAFLLKLVLKSSGIQTRLKDNLAVITYAHQPIIAALVLLLLVEYGIFGGHWIYFNPSPFIIKASSAYLLAGIEAVFILWQLVLLTIGIYTQSRNSLFSIIAALIVEATLIAGIGFIPPFIISLI